MIEHDVRDAAIEAPDPAWDELVERLQLPQFWLGSAIHAVAVAAGGPGRVLTTRTIIDGSTAVIACYRTLMSTPTADHRLARLTGNVGRRLWLCAPPVSFGSGLELAPELAATDRSRLRRAVERATFRLAGAGPHLVGYANLGRADLDRHGTARLVVRTAPTAVLDVTWPSLDRYLDSLPGRRRKRFARLLDDVERRGLVRFSFGSDQAVEPELFCRLEHRTRSRHAGDGVEPAPIPTGYVEACRAGRTGWFGYRSRDGRLLQADLAFLAGRQLWITATGGEDRSLADGLYTAVMLDEVAWAAANGIERIAVGPGAADQKRRFGCRLEDQYLAVRVRW